MRKQTNIDCAGCGIKFYKEDRYIKSALKKGRKNYCSLSCLGKITSQINFSEWNHSEENKKHLRSMSGNKKDGYTGFRVILSSCSKRNKECDLDLQYLKELWENQSGKCAVTNVDLKLQSSYNKNYQASIDRIDSSKGYIKGNVRFTSVSVNWLKSNLDDNHLREFFQIAKMVV